MPIKITRLIFIIFFAITFYSNAQEKIMFTNGDSITGIASVIDFDHIRILKSDGKSILVLSSMIINKKYSTTSVSISQNDTTSNVHSQKKEKRIHLKLFYSPSYSYSYRMDKPSTVTINEETNGEDYYGITYNTNQEIGNYSFNAGLEAEIKLNKKISLAIGFTYNNIGFKTKTIDKLRVDYSGMWAPPPYYGTIYYYNEFSYTYNYQYFSLPVTLLYYIKKGKFDYYSGLGVSAQYLNSFQIVEYDKYIAKDLNALSSKWSIYKAEIDYFATGKIGIECPIDKNIKIFFEPYFSYNFISSYLLSTNKAWNNRSVYEHFGNQLHLYVLGVSIGIKL